MSMNRFHIVFPLFVLACNNVTPIGPEPLRDGGSESSSSSSSSGSTSGGGSTCDDCMNVSGSRLKTIFFAGSDGAVSAYSGAWFDTSIQTNCAATVAPDGVLRCLPITDGLLISGLSFQNATCTIKLAQRSKCYVQPPKYANEFSTSGCSSAYHIYTLPSKWNGTIYTNSGGACAVQSPTSTAPYDFYEIGPEANYGAFVAVTESHE